MKTRSQTRKEQEIRKQGIINYIKDLPKPIKSIKSHNLKKFKVKHQSPLVALIHEVYAEQEYVKNIKMSDHLRQVEKLKMDGNISENWRKFKRNFEIYMIASGINSKGETVKINTFLNAIGDEAVDVYDTLNLTPAQRASYDEVIKAVEEFCKPKKNTVYERFVFYQRKQKEGEPFDTYLMDIKRLVRTCEFDEKENEMLRDQIVMGVEDKKLQVRLLETTDLTYDKTVEKCRAAEATKEQSSTMNQTVAIHELSRSNNKQQPNSWNRSNNNNTNGTDQRRPHGNTYQQNRQPYRRTQQNRNNGNIGSSYNDNRSETNKCKNCNYVHRTNECPALGKTCNTCSKLNHFSSVCKYKNVSVVTAHDDSYNFSDNEEFYIGTIENARTDEIDDVVVYPWTEKINMNGKDVANKIDTGAEIDVMPLSVFKRILELNYNKRM